MPHKSKISKTKTVNKVQLAEIINPNKTDLEKLEDLKEYFGDQIELLQDMVTYHLKLRKWQLDKKLDDNCLDLYNKILKKFEELIDTSHSLKESQEIMVKSKFNAKYLLTKDLVCQLGKLN